MLTPVFMHREAFAKLVGSSVRIPFNETNWAEYENGQVEHMSSCQCEPTLIGDSKPQENNHASSRPGGACQLWTIRNVVKVTNQILPG